MKRKIQIENYSITYTFVEKQVKNINLRINQNGEIFVSANPYVPIEKVDAFVAEKISWILEKQKQMAHRQKAFNQTTHVAYLGKKYPIQVIEDQHCWVKLGDSFEIHCANPQQISQLIVQFEINQCKKILLPIVEKYFQLMSQDYFLIFPKIKIRSMSSRWGSCIPLKHQITLNQKLIHYDIKFIEYVVLHELAHFIQPNHSKQFYHVIEKYMPDYKQASKLYEMNEEVY